MAVLMRLPVGARKVSRTGKGEPVVYLGKSYKWLEGKKVYVEIIVELEQGEEEPG